jgi:hypothetical protein
VTNQGNETGSRKAPQKHDYTSTRRANKRLSQYQQAAERDGFQNYSEAWTAWMKGEYVLVKAVPNTASTGLSASGSQPEDNSKAASR